MITETTPTALHDGLAPDAAPLTSALERALSPFAQQEAQLYRRDGTPVFAPAEHAERIAAIARDRDAAVAAAARDARERADRLAQEAETARALASADPIMRLPAPDLARAAALQPFVAADVAGEDARQLVARLRAAQQRNDLVELTVLARTVGPRLDQISQGGSSDLRPGETRPPLADARQLLGEIRAGLTPDAAQLKAKAAATLKRATDLRIWASRAVTRHGPAQKSDLRF